MLMLTPISVCANIYNFGELFKSKIIVIFLSKTVYQHQCTRDWFVRVSFFVIQVVENGNPIERKNWFPDIKPLFKLLSYENVPPYLKVVVSEFSAIPYYSSVLFCPVVSYYTYSAVFSAFDHLLHL